MSIPTFAKQVIGEIANPDEDGAMNVLSLVGDVNGDGRLDIVVSGRNGRMVWFENRGDQTPWPRHEIGPAHHIECGGTLCALTHSGYPDLIVGGDYLSDEVAWLENPGPQGGPWTRRLIAKTGSIQFHDVVVGDISGDGTRSLIFWNQHGERVYWVPLPADPRQSPWPGLRAIPTPLHGEGLALADLDGDGRNELVAGTHWCKYDSQHDTWEVHPFAEGYISTKVAVADIDGDGRLEILLSEGDACIYGKPQGGKFGWFKPAGDIRALWTEHLLEDYLLDPHSLRVGDLCGHGHNDVLLGEVGVGEHYEEHPPRLLLFENDGQAHFTRHVIDLGTGIHDAILAPMRQAGVLDIVGKPLHGAERWNVHIWYNEREGNAPHHS